MVLDLCGGTPSEVTIEGARNAEDRVLNFPVSEVKRLSGLEVPLVEMRRVLDKLGFFVAGQGEAVKVAIPSWRCDIEGKADIVEEVVRIIGVDRVPFTPFERDENARKPVLTALQVRTRKAKRALGGARAGRGGHLVVHRQGAGRAVRRRAGGACARQSDRRGPVRHAAESHSRARDGGAAQRGSRICRRGAVRGRADLQGRPAGRPAHRGFRRAPRARAARTARDGTGPATARPTCST